jgi:ubiquinone/menaquinone biosynthesis C-methylase UbiE
MEDHEYWSEYWSQGHKTSFGNDFKHCYEGRLQEAWGNVFKAINSKSTVLDLCTGNAALLRLAEQDMTNFPEVNFTGVDYANVTASDHFTQLQNIELLFNVNIEKLPLKNNTYDFVISNYGIEYSDLAKSLAEVYRVMSDNGHAIFICHFHDSVFIKNNRQELMMISTMLEKNGVLEVLQGLVNALTNKSMYSKIPPSKEHLQALEDAEHYRHLLNDKLAIIANNFTKAFYQSDFLGFLKYLLSTKVENKKIELKLFRKGMLSHQGRLYEMVNAALTKEQIDKLSVMFKAHALYITKTEVLKSQEGAIGYQIYTSKGSYI